LLSLLCPRCFLNINSLLLLLFLPLNIIHIIIIIIIIIIITIIIIIIIIINSDDSKLSSFQFLAKIRCLDLQKNHTFFNFFPKIFLLQIPFAYLEQNAYYLTRKKNDR
jgi:hypothetical protein